MRRKIELGITSFGETTPLENTGKVISHSERIQNLVEEIELADNVGLDIFAIGEHHRSDFAVSVPEMVLSAGAVNTKNIRLSSAVTVLSSSEPIRVYQNFATLDAISKGRAEIMVGRGSFIESFPLFGYDLEQYGALFQEKLDMLIEINKQEKLTWEGRLTHSVDNKGIYPRAIQKELPIWVATGGSPESTIRTAKMGLPIAFAIIGGEPMAFKELIDAYRRIGKEWGHSDDQLKVASHSWGYIAENNNQAIEEYYHPTKTSIDNISKDRAHWQPLTKEQYLNSVGDHGAMFVGDPTTVAIKIINVVEKLQLDRFMLHLPLGSLPHQSILNSINLFGKEVAPKVRNYFENL